MKKEANGKLATPHGARVDLVPDTKKDTHVIDTENYGSEGTRVKTYML